MKGVENGEEKKKLQNPIWMKSLIWKKTET